MNLIFNALAIDDKARGSTNVSDIFLKSDGYIKNSVVSLFSAKQNNPECECALILNFEINKHYHELFEEFNIKIFYVPFDKFYFSKNYNWSLAFYKLCALDYVVNNLNYDNYCLLDTDTVSIDAFDNIWKECEHNILLFDIQHSLDIQQAITMNQEYKNLNQIHTYLTNYGGEFIAGSKEKLSYFLERSKLYYHKMLSSNFKTKHGDEFIIACVAEETDIKNKIKNANAYINRFWTRNFYLISTNYIYNPICVLHLTDEKNSGIICLYNYIDKNRTLPKKNKIFKILNLPTQKSNIRKKLNLKKHSMYIKILNTYLNNSK